MIDTHHVFILLYLICFCQFHKKKFDSFLIISNFIKYDEIYTCNVGLFINELYIYIHFLMLNILGLLKFIR